MVNAMAANGLNGAQEVKVRDCTAGVAGAEISELEFSPARASDGA